MLCRHQRQFGSEVTRALADQKQPQGAWLLVARKYDYVGRALTVILHGVKLIKNGSSSQSQGLFVPSRSSFLPAH
jgi:hypothetical protein